MERLQKYLARCGVASRRRSEELIRDGRITVNGEVITEMGYKVKNKDIVAFDGETVNVVDKVYLVMNKPRYLISSANDEKGRKTVVSILPSQYEPFRVYPVGRLDYDTKGILLLTNDGDFMNTLVGPKSLLEKEYLVRIDGIVTKEDIKKLENGVDIDGYITRKCRATLDSVDQKNNSCLLRIVLQEGKNHQIKRMIMAIGYEVKRLTRIRFGQITIDNIKEGEVRELTPHEIKTLLVDATTEKDYSYKKVRNI